MATKKSIDKPEYAVVLAVLRALRTKAGLTQAELGEALGRYQRFVSGAEDGSRRLDPLQVAEWCVACGVSYQDFARRVEEGLELMAEARKKPKPKPRK